MSKQPKIHLSVAGGQWRVAAHKPNAAGLKYHVELEIAGETVCNAFCYEIAHVKGNELLLGAIHIRLEKVDIAAATKFVADTTSYVKGGVQ